MNSEAIRASRHLLRSRRQATLATQIRGQPFAALVTPATAPDLSVLLLLSTLSEHTRHLLADRRCAVAFSGLPEGPNPQSAPRVTVTGVAEQVDDAGLKARWLAVHPYAGNYASFTDFGLWRIRPQAALFVGGFARAARLRAGELQPATGAIANVSAAEASIIAHCNNYHADAMQNIAIAAGGAEGAWRMVVCDVDGFDLLLGETALRIPFDAPIADANDVRRELVRLSREARAA